MLTQIENNKGIISYDNALVDQVIAEVISAYQGSVKLVKKSYEMTQFGVDMDLECHLRFGTSISAFAEYVLRELYDTIDGRLELPVNRISLLISGIYSKKTAPRRIRFEINNKSEITNH
jgi:uncharacterized alkaline shock family protein YloU